MAAIKNISAQGCANTCKSECPVFDFLIKPLYCYGELCMLTQLCD